MRLRKSRPDFMPSVDGGVVDLFCGIGGLTHGFVLEGFNVVAGIDVDAACAYGYETNNSAKFLKEDVGNLTGDMLNKMFPANGPRILVGCAPCQPFSTYVARKGISNPRWKLLQEFKRLVNESLPDFVSMENVPGLVRYQGGQLFQEFVEDLIKFNYEVKWKLVECEKLGVPQSRTRLVLLASLNSPIEFNLPRRKKRTVRDTIGHLIPIEAGSGNKHDPMHKSQALSELNMKRMRQSKPGGTWNDWDREIIAKCHLKKSGDQYLSIYGRMKWDDIAPTLTTQCFSYGSGRFGHPEQDRAMSLREASLLQSFPPYYEFHRPDEPPTFHSTGRFIGNAVPVELGRCIARNIREAIESERTRQKGKDRHVQ